MNKNQNNQNNNSTAVCIYDENGIHYPCSTCGKYYDDDLDALLCCLLTECDE